MLRFQRLNIRAILVSDLHGWRKSAGRTAVATLAILLFGLSGTLDGMFGLPMTTYFNLLVNHPECMDVAVNGASVWYQV